MKKFKTFKYQLEMYQNETRCLTILEKNGDEYLTISTNIDSQLQDQESIFIKNDLDYEELAHLMCTEGYLTKTEVKANEGYNTYTLYKMTPKLFSIASEA